MLPERPSEGSRFPRSPAGMDIKHMATARAALTLGKDMVFRDLSQVTRTHTAKCT